MYALGTQSIYFIHCWHHRSHHCWRTQQINKCVRNRNRSSKIRNDGTTAAAASSACVASEMSSINFLGMINTCEQLPFSTGVTVKVYAGAGAVGRHGSSVPADGNDVVAIEKQVRLIGLQAVIGDMHSQEHSIECFSSLRSVRCHFLCWIVKRYRSSQFHFVLRGIETCTLPYVQNQIVAAQRWTSMEQTTLHFAEAYVVRMHCKRAQFSVRCPTASRFDFPSLLNLLSAWATPYGSQCIHTFTYALLAHIKYSSLAFHTNFAAVSGLRATAYECHAQSRQRYKNMKRYFKSNKCSFSFEIICARQHSHSHRHTAHTRWHARSDRMIKREIYTQIYIAWKQMNELEHTLKWWTPSRRTHSSNDRQQCMQRLLTEAEAEAPQR